MTFLGVVGHRRNQILLAVDPGFREMPPSLAFAVHGLLGVEAEALLKSSGHFYHESDRTISADKDVVQRQT
jgi:hypothetical protein